MSRRYDDGNGDIEGVLQHRFDIRMSTGKKRNKVTF